MSQVRVRFAPSPTGFFHIGSARTALFNWLYARHTGGVFILRVEDTDKARSTDEFLTVIYDSMAWLGLDWDEGPKVGGDFGPYRQSERSAIYEEYLNKLRAADRVYEKEGATWFKISGEPQVIEDAIRGRVERTEEKDFVIVRSDGNPVFHLVNVVDDIAMGVTHVIRGEDHLSNTSKHTELFKAFGAPLPTFAHIPLILKQNGPGKMSKRDEGALVEEYLKRGYLPEAVVNFLCLLGWNPKDDQEKMPIAEIISRFDFPGVNQSNARFDDRKMAHMNMTYLLELPLEDYLVKARNIDSEQGRYKAFSAAAPGSDEGKFFDAVIAASQAKVKAIDELPAYTEYFWSDSFPWNPKAINKTFKKGDPVARLGELREVLAELVTLDDEEAVEAAIKSGAESCGYGFGDYQAGARLAVTGTNAGPGLTTIFRILGKDEVITRMDRFISEPPKVD